MNPKLFLKWLVDKGLDFYTGVPDSLLGDFIIELHEPQNCIQHVSATNEGSAVALAIGHYLATNKTPVVYMQNSGLGNAINPIVSLAHKNVYQIPMLLIIGWRGEPGISDEPQHLTQGAITLEMLEILEIPYLPINNSSSFEQIEEFIDTHLARLDQPFALVVSKDTFDSNSDKTMIVQNEQVSREQALVQILASIKQQSIVISTTGKLSRELNEVRESMGQVACDFMTVGGMGHAAGIALGVSLANKSKETFCLDGDGAILMHLGALAMVGAQESTNFVHVIFDNGVHESVGGQPIASQIISYPELAKALGYRSSFSLVGLEQIAEVFGSVDSIEKPCLISIKVSSDSRKNLSRPSKSPRENRDSFMEEFKRLILRG